MSAADFLRRRFLLRGAVLFICLYLAAAALFSAGFVTAHLGHHHETPEAAETCTVCAVVQAVQNLNLKLTAPVFPVLFLISFMFGAAALFKPVFRPAISVTPVSLKIRLNN
jgi:hypothetical protein